MRHIISKTILIKTFLLTLGLASVKPLFFRGLDKLNTHRQLVIISENDRKYIPLGDEMMLAAFEKSSKLKNDPHLLQTSLKVRTKSPNQSTSLVKAVFISVKDFGAIGNGIADDTTAIQKAIDTVNKSGGGVVFFPSGTYKVTINPATSQSITIRSKLTLRGSGHKKSIIKLGDRQGNYNSILAGETYSSDLSNFAMYDIAIDGNSRNNPVIVESDVQGTHQFRYALRIFVGKMIHIERSRFTSQNNVNTITINGENSISNVTIKSNIFESIGGGSIDYDHSTIYTHGKKIKILNNYFYSKNGAGTNGARTAIEIHGDDHIVKGNIINGFSNGINITGYAKSSNNQSVTDNVIKEAYSGITIWSYFDGGNMINPGLANCVIANNKITLNINDWGKLWGNTSSAGIWLHPQSDAPIQNMNIVNNQITFTNFTGQGSTEDKLGNGIRLWRYSSPNVITENIRISGNKIKNSLAAGIYISMPIKKGEISQNTIVNPGQSKSSFHDDYRAAIIVDGIFNDVKVNENLLVDNQISNTMKGGIIWFSNCEAKCEAKRNSLDIASGAILLKFRSKSQSSLILD
jgi:hypothetical protein